MDEGEGVNKLLFEIENKEVEPRVYAFLMKSKLGKGIYLGVAYNFEEAIESACNQMNGVVGKELNWVIGIHKSKPISQVVAEAGSMTFDGKSEKNELMKEIIDKKDKKLYNKNKSKFNKVEKKLIEEKIDG